MSNASKVKKYCKPQVFKIGNAVNLTLGNGSGRKDASARRYGLGLG